jgi:hypothetical protein
MSNELENKSLKELKKLVLDASCQYAWQLSKDIADDLAGEVDAGNVSTRSEAERYLDDSIGGCEVLTYTTERMIFLIGARDFGTALSDAQEALRDQIMEHIKGRAEDDKTRELFGV